MIKTLYVGDPHFKHTQKQEMESLMSFVRQSALDNKVEQIVILGDLNDTFGVLRTENLYFWENWLNFLSDICKVYVLCGNHDKKNQGDDNDFECSIAVFNLLDQPNLNIIQSPVTFGPFCFVPYMHDKKRFVEQANQQVQNGAKVLIAHAEFDGAAYDNGFFIKDGIKQEDLNYDLIISGHIHSRSRFGKVIYPGNPRWLTSSDANKEKGLWLVTHDSQTGAILDEQFLDTSHVCTPIYSIQYKEGGNCPEIPEGSKTSIELVGSSEWVKKEKMKFKGIAAVSCKITDKTKPQNRRTGHNMADFVNNTFEPLNGVGKEQMLDFMKEAGVL